MKKLSRFIRGGFGVIYLCIFLVVIFCSKEDYIYKKEFLHGNVMYATIAIAVTLLFVALSSLLKGSLKAIDGALADRLAAVATAVLFVLQVYVSYNILFAPGWDSSIVVKAARYSAGYAKKTEEWYYSYYPNNLLLIELYGLLLKLNRWAGVFSSPYDVMSIVVVNALLASLTCRMVYVILRRLYGARWALAAFAMSVLLFGISPWTSVCYSDSLGLFFPALILCIYTWEPASGRGRAIRYAGLVLASCVGYMLKPYVLIVSIAIVIVSVGRAVSRNRARAIRGLAVIVGLCLCFIGVQRLMACGVRVAVEKVDGIAIDDEMTHDWQHFFMMGMNVETQGGFSGEDCFFSEAIASREERSRSNLEVALSRIRAMKLSGFLGLMKKKILNVFNDGTFAWGAEGNFFKKIYDPPNQGIAPVLRELVYDGGRYARQFMSFEQFIWIMVLAMSLMSVFAVRRDGTERVILVMMLALLGLALYEALFEVRARYLYVYAPVFSMLATIGLKGCVDLAARIRTLHASNALRR